MFSTFLILFSLLTPFLSLFNCCLTICLMSWQVQPVISWGKQANWVSRHPLFTPPPFIRSVLSLRLFLFHSDVFGSRPSFRPFARVRCPLVFCFNHHLIWPHFSGPKPTWQLCDAFRKKLQYGGGSQHLKGAVLSHTVFVVEHHWFVRHRGLSEKKKILVFEHNF